jgi:hypothetical protein
MTPVLGILSVAILLAVILTPLVLFIRAEDRRNDAFVAHLERMGRECPACKPWGGYILGREREDGSVETITCDVCGGTGELPR